MNLTPSVAENGMKKLESLVGLVPDDLHHSHNSGTDEQKKGRAPDLRLAFLSDTRVVNSNQVTLRHTL